MNNHRNLRIWQLAGDLIVAIYDLTRKLPRDEERVVIPQLRRAAWSVQNNIAEGNAKRGKAEMRRFFDTATASLAEVDSMVGELERLYELDAAEAARIEELRRSINAGIFKLLRSGGR